MYAGGKYHNDANSSYEYSLGLNGLGLCATQYASEYMDVDIRTGDTRYTLHFEKGRERRRLHKEPYKGKSGTKIRWKPDLAVFTDINIPIEYYLDTIQAAGRCKRGRSFLPPKRSGRPLRNNGVFLSERHCGSREGARR